MDGKPQWKMERVPNDQIRELSGVAKGVNKRIDESGSDGLPLLKEWGMIDLLKQ